jgi:hypothetical protein
MMALSGTLWASTQLQDGAFVIAQDGSRWVVSGGVRYPINWTVDDTGAISQLPEGPAISTVGELATAPPPVQAPPAVAGIPGLTADYRFQDGFASSAGGPPELITLGPTSFITDRVDGPERTVLAFQEGSGLQLSPASTAIPSSVYTIVMLFRLDSVDGYRRLIDFTNGTADPGIYVRSGDLNFYPTTTGAGTPIAANAYNQVAVTRDSSGAVTGYVNGLRQIVANDSPAAAVVSAANTVRFFRDDGREHSGGAVARIRFYDRALSADEIAALDRL